jgi:hypothetical protein
MNERINIGNDIKVWATLSKRNHPKRWYGEERTYIVNVFTIHMKKDGDEVRFSFYDSVYHWSKGVTKMGADDLKNAVDCILSDALSGMFSHEEFCNEYGYDPFDNKAKRVYNQCKDALDKVLTLMGKDDIYNILNEIQ